MPDANDKRLYQALLVLKTDENGKALLEHLRAELEKERGNGDYIASEIEMRWNQGRRQALQDLIDKFNNAGEILDKLTGGHGKQTYR